MLNPQQLVLGTNLVSYYSSFLHNTMIVMPSRTRAIPKYIGSDIFFHSSKKINPTIIGPRTISELMRQEAIDSPNLWPTYPKLKNVSGAITIVRAKNCQVCFFHAKVLSASTLVLRTTAAKTAIQAKAIGETFICASSVSEKISQV